MRHTSELTFLTACFVLACASAQEPSPAGSCPIPASASPLRFSRLHQIPTVAERGDPIHTIVTPGGMVLSSPKMVAATDVLTVVARDANVVCFHLLTFARDRRRCELQGIARKEADGTYIFREGPGVVRLTFTAADQVTVEPVGVGYRDRCEPSGQIERAIYKSSEQR